KDTKNKQGMPILFSNPSSFFSLLFVSSWLVCLGMNNDLACERAAFADGAFFLESVGFGGLGEREDAVDAWFEFAGGEPAVHVGCGGGLFFVGGVEHREADQAAVFGVERADGENGSGVAAGHENHAATFGE